ncbi:MAG: LysM peptidoglycan-binding domain-containing protein [Alphaproteobacteria bacterium]|nr:LysM peptidoglycan-binding domain-containing protein [Alphaproteobacteria bacterium]
MGSKSLSKLVLTAAVSSAVMTAGLMVTGMSAFAAGRCGGVYAVDSATTLTRVAQRCHVSLSALYEANPGVDPSNVRPGARLAIPSEINRYSVGATYSAPDSSTPDNTGDASTTTDTYSRSVRYDPPMQSSDYDLMDSDRYSHRTGVRDIRGEGQAPSWMRTEVSNDGNDGGMSGGGGRYLINDRLSYQKQSALRIHNAAVPALQPALMNMPATPALKTSLIKCTDLRTTDGRKIHQVRKIITTPEDTYVEVVMSSDASGADCTLMSRSTSEESAEGVLPARFTSPTKLSPPDYRLPDYSRIGVTPRMIKVNETFSLKGEIADSYGDCLLLRTKDNRLWRLSSPNPSLELIGKTVTVWGKSVTGGVCGGGATMVVSHAIYAEPWIEN